jgi:hypothetical protein
MEMRQMTKISITYEFLEQGIPKNLGVSRRTIIRWSQAICEHGGLHNFWITINKPRQDPARSGRLMQS